VIAGLGWALAEFGSLRHAWLYASGIRLAINKTSVQVPDGKPGDERDAAFLVHNLSDRPVQIVGVHTSRVCVSTEKLPVTVPPTGAKELRLTLHLEDAATGTVEQVVTYHTDEPSVPRFEVRVSGRVIDR
jgi:hypothetical protein